MLKWAAATIASGLVLITIDFLIFGEIHWLWIVSTLVVVEAALLVPKILKTRR